MFKNISLFLSCLYCCFYWLSAIRFNALLTKPARVDDSLGRSVAHAQSRFQLFMSYIKRFTKSSFVVITLTRSAIGPNGKPDGGLLPHTELYPIQPSWWPSVSPGPSWGGDVPVGIWGTKICHYYWWKSMLLATILLEEVYTSKARGCCFLMFNLRPKGSTGILKN